MSSWTFTESFYLQRCAYSFQLKRLSLHVGPSMHGSLNELWLWMFMQEKIPALSMFHPTGIAPMCGTEYGGICPTDALSDPLWAAQRKWSQGEMVGFWTRIMGMASCNCVFRTGKYRGIKLITSQATPISRKRTLIPSLSNEVPLLYLHIMKGLLNQW